LSWVCLHKPTNSSSDAQERPTFYKARRFIIIFPRDRHLDTVRFPALPDFLRRNGPGTGSTQPREYTRGASSGSVLESREYSRRNPSRWPRDTLYPQTLTLSSTSGGRSVGVVRSRTEATEFRVLATYPEWERTKVRELWGMDGVCADCACEVETKAVKAKCSLSHKEKETVCL
jgi:hypothetical protein